jgi:hypothetical protein
MSFRLLTVLTFIVAAATRLWLHFSTPLVQGMNGGYYLVQARSLIEKFSLAIPDLPLVFTIHACVAKVLHVLSPLTLEASVKLAVKMMDSLLPALAVVPVMLLGRVWSKGDKVDLGIIAFAAVLVPAGAPALMMLGDFEKNSLGLTLLCTLAWALYRWAEDHTRQLALIAVGVLGLIGLTHIGVFGTTLIFIGSSLLALAGAHGREGLFKVGKLALIALPVVVLAAGLVFWKFDPARVQKLLHAFSDPSDYLSSGGGPTGRGGPMMGPPGMSTGWMQYAPMAAFALAAIPGLIMVWWKRRVIGLPSLVVVSGAAITVILLTGPWVHGDKVMRFQLNAVPLAVLCLLFALLQIPHRWARGLPGVLILMAALTPSVMKLQSGARPIITVEAQKELQALVSRVEDPEHTLIVARHGLEWWTAWTLHTHIAQAQALSSEDWKKYRYVWFIEEKRGMGFPMGPQPGQGGSGPSFLGSLFGFGGPGNPQRRPDDRRDERIAMQPPGGRDFLGGRNGPPMGMRGAPIPEEAEILHQGEHFKLAWVREPPVFVRQRELNPLDIFAGLGL